jgi:hypothetical protein
MGSAVFDFATIGHRLKVLRGQAASGRMFSALVGGTLEAAEDMSAETEIQPLSLSVEQRKHEKLRQAGLDGTASPISGGEQFRRSVQFLKDDFEPSYAPDLLENARCIGPESDSSYRQRLFRQFGALLSANERRNLETIIGLQLDGFGLARGFPRREAGDKAALSTESDHSLRIRAWWAAYHRCGAGRFGLLERELAESGAPLLDQLAGVCGIRRNRAGEMAGIPLPDMDVAITDGSDEAYVRDFLALARKHWGPYGLLSGYWEAQSLSRGTSPEIA